MSNQYYSTFSASSYSSTSDGSGNTYSTSTSSNPSGTTVRATSQQAGQPAVTRTTKYPTHGTQQVGGGTGNERRIEDVTDAERDYEEKMEEEYAKREGGA